MNYTINTKSLSNIHDGDFFKLTNKRNKFMKLYDVLAKESTLCFDLLTKKVVMFKNYEQVIPLDVKMEFSYKGENNYEMQ